MHLAVRRNSIYTSEVKLPFFWLYGPRGIGEIYGAIGSCDNIVRGVEPELVPALRYDLDPACVFIGPCQAAVATFAHQKISVVIKGQAVS